MENGKSKIIVRDVETKQVLFECAVDESEKAWQFAASMEELGLNIEVLSPTLSDTLSDSLGLTNSEKQEYKESLEEEMEAHEGSCCFTENDGHNGQKANVVKH